jgi:hypothetical protein
MDMIIRTYPALPSLWRPVYTVLWNGNAGEVETIKAKRAGRPRAGLAAGRCGAGPAEAGGIWRQAGGIWRQAGEVWRQAGGMRGWRGRHRSEMRRAAPTPAWAAGGSGRWRYGGLAGAAQQRNGARRVGLGSKDRVQAKVAVRLQPRSRSPALPLRVTGHGRTGGGREAGWPGKPTQLGRIRCRLGCPTRL